MKQILLSLLSILYTLHLWGQVTPGQYIFEPISQNSGFTYSAITAIATDKNNMVWFGCDNGVYYYDNKRLKHYRHNPQDPKTIASNKINLIYKDSSHRLWVLTHVGLSYYDSESDTFHNVKFDNIQNQFNTSIFAEYAPNNFVIGIDGHLYTFCSESIDNLQKVPFYTDVSTIYNNGDGTLYIGCQDGQIYTTDKSLSKFIFLYGDVNSRITALCEHDARLYIGYQDRRLNVIDSQTGHLVREYTRIGAVNDYEVPYNDIRTIAKRANGDIWVGTGDGCVIISSEENYIIRSNSFNLLPRNSIHSIHVDKYDAVWVGTWAGSVGYFNDTNYKFRYGIGNPSNNIHSGVGMVSHFAPNDSSSTWVGGESSGLSLHTSRDNKYIEHYGTNLHIKTLERDDNGDLWIGTIGQGLHHFNVETKKITKIKIPEEFESESIISAIAVDKKRDLIWVGSRGQGIFSYNTKTKECERYNIGTNYKEGSIWDLKIIDNNLYIVSNGGFAIRTSDGQFTRYKFSDDSLSDSEAYSMCYMSRSNELYIGTKEYGVQLFDIDNLRFKEFAANNIIKEHITYDILADSKNRLWISTNNGIYLYNNVSKELKHFTSIDGLATLQFHPGSCTITPNDVVYFGSTVGFNYINGSYIRANPILPNAYISSIFINNEPLSELNCEYTNSKHTAEISEIRLSHSNNSITLQATSNNNLKRDNIAFRYRLHGYQDQWITINADRDIAFTKLPFGNYTLELMASNNDGLWGESSEIDIKISAPLYLTWYALVLYFILVVIIILYIAKQAAFKIKAKKDIELERQINIINSKSFDEKVKFFMNISHEIRTPLSLIKAPLGILEQELKNKESAIHLNAIKRNTEQLLKLTNQILDFRLLEVGKLQPTISKFDIIKLSKEILELFEYSIKDRQIDFTFELSAESIVVALDKDMISKIIYNLLTNAIKYTEEGAAITLRIQSKELKAGDTTYDILKGTPITGSALIIAVEDNGAGIKPDQLDHLFERFYYNANEAFSSSGIGLHMCMEYANLHGGNINVSSQEGKGSKFSIVLPLAQMAATDEAQLIATTPYEATTIDTFESIEEVRDSHKSTVLIVDDNTEIRFYLKKILNKSYNCITAKNGQQGYTLAADIHPDIIILDVLMPIMGGIDCALKLREDKSTKNIPIIMLTGLTDDNRIIQGVRAGADAYISKPINETLLFAHIERLISKHNEATTITDQKDEVTMGSGDNSSFKQSVETVMEQNLQNNMFNVNMMADLLLISRSTLHRNFKNEMNIGVSEYIRDYRLQSAIKLMNSGVNNIDELATCVGFSSSSYFCKAFKDKYGVSPKKHYDSLKVIK